MNKIFFPKLFHFLKIEQLNETLLADIITFLNDASNEGK
jgi:hypothetical protein